MEHNVNTAWKGNMQFETEVSGHKFIMDAGPDMGGEDAGPRPKPMLLSALAGCTGMDVVSILKKMRVPIEGLNIKIAAQLTDEHPKHYSDLHIVYEFTGKDLPLDKLEKAVQMSQETYCGVSFMFRKAMKISFEIVIAA